MPRVLAHIVYVLLVLPILVVLGASLTAGSYIRFPPDGLSVRWYQAMFHDGDMVHGIWLSMEIALVAVAFALLIGTLAALYLSRLGPRSQNVLASLFLSPLSVPLVLTGFAMLVLFTQFRLVNMLGLIIGHIVVTVPYVLRTVMASLSLTDPFVPQAAAILGARPWQVFWHVILPILRPGLIAGGLFTFLASFNNVTISIFLSVPGASPLPVVIFNRMENLAEPSSAAAASVAIVLTAASVLVLEWRFSMFRSVLGGAR
jgi:putative spermidine/putrescine transport system permease protein